MMIILAEFMGGKPVGDRALVVAVVTPFEMEILHTLYAKLFADKRQHVDFHLVLHYWGEYCQNHMKDHSENAVILSTI